MDVIPECEGARIVTAGPAGREPDWVEEARRLAADGLHLREVARRVKRTHDTVRKGARRHGIWFVDHPCARRRRHPGLRSGSAKGYIPEPWVDGPRGMKFSMRNEALVMLTSRPEPLRDVEGALRRLGSR